VWIFTFVPHKRFRESILIFLVLAIWLFRKRYEAETDSYLSL